MRSLIYLEFQLKDRHINSARSVLIDQKQDWQLLYSREQNGYTVFKFTRLTKTCDSQDREIEVRKIFETSLS